MSYSIIKPYPCSFKSCPVPVPPSLPLLLYLLSLLISPQVQLPPWFAETALSLETRSWETRAQNWFLSPAPPPKVGLLMLLYSKTVFWFYYHIIKMSYSFLRQTFSYSNLSFQRLLNLFSHDVTTYIMQREGSKQNSGRKIRKVDSGAGREQRDDCG
jgi:hypothetical protein